MEWFHAGAPISHVLNDAGSSQGAAESQPNAAAPFSGKLIDLLLEPHASSDLTHERRRQGDHLEEVQRSAESSVITLPQPAQPSSRTARRPRIPPLLQGLHQPPPLPPNGRLFPPITDGVSGFERELRDRVQSGNATHDNQDRSNEQSLFPSKGDSSSPLRVRNSQVRNEQDDNASSTPAVDADAGRKQHEPGPQRNRPSSPQQPVKKRKKWTEEETRDLLLGVSRFGIGNWKKILLCPDFHFVGRTAVDLKDKFRVCCPADGRKPKRRKRAEDGPELAPATRAIDDSESPSADATQSTVSAPRKPFAEGAGNVHKLDEAELAKIGIQTPFAKSQRRPRHAFTTRDDENLLKGFNKHGAAWLSIRDDRELGFENRRPTDLRDRFRIRYPEEYEKAGLKGKLKPAKKIKEIQEASSARQEPPPESEAGSSQSKDTRSVRDDHPQAPEHGTDERALQRPSPMRPHVLTSSYQNINTIFLDDNPTDENETFSPIRLSRNILHWADANTTSASSTSNAPSFTQPHPRDIPPTTSFPHDGLHINPMVTLKLPMLMLSDPTSYNHYPDSNTASMPTWFSRPPSDNALLRTPNLPTIVFPHVPAISARTTVHNLPTPADLLSGMEVEGGEGAPVIESADLR